MIGQALREMFEFVGGFEAGFLSAFHGEGIVNQRVARGDEQVAAAAGGAGPERDGQRQGHGHRPHLEAGLVHADDLRVGFQLLVNAVEDGVVVDLHGDQQAGRGNLQRAAGQRHGHVVGWVEREDQAEFAAERVEEVIPFDLGFLFKFGGEFLQPFLRLGQVGLGDFLLRNGPEHRQVQVRENGQRGVGRQEV